MSMNITYNTTMGFAINGTAIADPATYGYKSQSLDISANRDTKGLLHRKMVATKYNVSLEWHGLDYVTASNILRSVRVSKFTFAFPCPEVPIDQNNGIHIGSYYVGDRTFDVVKAVGTDKSKWVCNMSFDLIEF